MLLPHTYKSLIYKKIALTSFPIMFYYILHKVFVYANPLGSPLPHLTQGQTSSRAGRGILSDIKIGWRIKCTYSRVSRHIACSKKNEQSLCTISKYEVVMHV